jgi:hypothetical protein
MRHPILMLSTALAFAPLTQAQASDRHFTFTHETDVLSKGDFELEPWTTFRVGRPDGFFRVDERIEFEVGLGHRLQTSLYLNATAKRAGDGQGGFTTESAFEGVSWELKGKLSDPVADAIGSGLYLEISAGPEEVEFEGKVLLDKSVGNFIGALNLVAEAELAFHDEGLHPEAKFEVDLGLAGRLSEHVTLGVEVRQHNLIEAEDGETKMELAHSALFAGPTVAWRSDKWWGALTVMPQVARLGGEGTGILDLEEYENVSTRLVFGVHL